VGVRSTGISQIEIESFMRLRESKGVPHSAEPDEIAAELLKPAVYKELRVGFNRFDLTDFFSRNDNASNDCSVARYSDMLQGPTITQELGPEVPFLCPIRFQALSSFLVPDNRPSVPLSKHIEAANVDKGIAARVEGESGEIKWD
jgi:hypothetical protein